MLALDKQSNTIPATPGLSFTPRRVILASFFEKVIKIKTWDWNNPIYTNLDNAIVTNLKKVNKKTLKKLRPILSRFISDNKVAI